MKRPALLLLVLALAATSASAQLETLPVASRPKPLEVTGPQAVDLKLDGTPRDFDIDEMPVGRALEKFGAATGMKLVVPSDMYGNRLGAGSPSPSSKLAQLHERKMPMWPALVKLLDQVADDRSFTWHMCMVSEDSLVPFSGRYCASKAFLVVANRLERAADYQRRPGETEQFFLHLTVAAEPGLRMIESPQTVLAAEAQDSAGHSMQPPAAAVTASTRPASVERYGRTDWRFDTTVQLTKPEAAGEKIKIIKGTIPVGVISRMQTLRLAAAGETTLNVEGTKMTLIFKELSSSYDLTAQFAWDRNQEGAKLLDGRVAAARIRLFDAAGNEYPVSNGGSGYGPGQRSMRATVRRDGGTRKLGPAVEARLEVPLATQIIEIPFEFRDLPMP